MKLYEAIFDTLDRFGLEQIKTERLINYLADYRAFEVKPAKAILREFLKAGYGDKVYQLNIDDAPDKLIKLRSFGMDLIQSYGFNDVHVNYVLDSICYALLWIETPPEDPEGAISGIFSNSANSVSGYAQNSQLSPQIKHYWHEPNPEFNPDTASINDDEIEQCWDLLPFARMHGKMQVAPFMDKITKKQFKLSVFSQLTYDESVVRTYVRFSKTLGELTPEQIVQEKDILRVAKLKDGHYELFRGEIAFISLFTAKWCRYSLDLIRSLQVKGIKYAEIDVDDQKEISTRYNIRNLPTIFINDANEQPIIKWVGYDADDHQVIELEDFLKKTKYKVIPHPEGRDVDLVAFETACHQVDILKAKYGQEIGVEESELLIFCCSAQIDFSVLKSTSYLSLGPFARIYNMVRNHIIQMKTPEEWNNLFSSQNGKNEDSEMDYASLWMGDYISERLVFYSSLLPYLVSDRLPNYKHTIQNLYKLMHVEFCVFYDSSIHLLMLHSDRDMSSFTMYDGEETDVEYAKPTSSFISAIKDIVFEAKII